MDSLEADIAETLSFLEAIFPPSFFDIMVHLMVHLPAQARIAALSIFVACGQLRGNFLGHINTVT
jgi:hypothetical protein